MKKPKLVSKKTGLVAMAAHPFELVSSVESQIAGHGGCITWQGYRACHSEKEPLHWPEFYLATLMRNTHGDENPSEYNLMALGGQSPSHAIEYTVLSHGAEATFVVKGKTKVIEPGKKYVVPKYKVAGEPLLIRFKGDVLFLRAEPVSARRKCDPNEPPKIPPPPYPGGGNERAN